MQTKNLSDLCDAVGVSGHEFALSEQIQSQFHEFCDVVESDFFGNVIGVIKIGKGKRIMLEAHYDEVGLIVTRIEDNGFLRFAAMGGIDPAILPATEVLVHSREGQFFGVIGAKPPHLQSSDDKKTITIDEMYIDVGLRGDVAKQKIAVGDVISFRGKSEPLLGSFFAAKSLDNRAGIMTLIECGKRICANSKKKGAKSGFKNIGEVILLASVQEEVGLRGATVGAYKLAPDAAIVIDVTHGTSPSVKEQEGFALGEGVAIGVGPNLTPDITNILIETAKKHKTKGLKYKLEVCPGSSGTNAWAIQVALGGIPTALVSIPLRYMHTPSEVVDMSDVDACVELIVSSLY